ncbi:MAG: DUF6036 family nucleotidyltransferase [Nitrososphaerales archaeon]
MPEGLFDKAEILAHLGEVADLLATERHPQATLVVVGGSYLVLHDLRAMGTSDVDSIERLTQALRSAVERVALENDLSTDWLNDRAAMFAPVGFERSDCSVLFEHSALLVLGPKPDWVFLMKLHASREVDRDDMVALWPRCSFTSPEEAAERYKAAYPHEQDDPYLAGYIAELASATTARGDPMPPRVTTRSRRSRT